MPKIKPLKFSDYSKDYFHHDQELESLILTLYVTEKLQHKNGCYVVSNNYMDVKVQCSRIEDYINQGQPLKLINASLFSRQGSWNPQAITSHTMIDKTTLYTLLKLLS